MNISKHGELLNSDLSNYGVSSSSVNNVDVSSTANLYKSLAQAAPDIKQCVDACNFIAESTRQQNTIGSVSIRVLDATVGLCISSH